MPTIHDAPFTFDIEQVLRYQGIKDGAKVQPQIITLVHELLTAVNHLRLLESAIAYELHPTTEVRLENCPSAPVVSLLAPARELAVIVCTIGHRLEEKVGDYFAQNDLLRAVLLDGIGSTAVEALAQEACRLIQCEAASRGYETSSSLRPGMQGWPVSEQWRLFRLVRAERIGVHLTPSGMMVPRKSISMVIGIGMKMPTWTQAEVCDRCSLKQTCSYKVRPRGDKGSKVKSRYGRGELMLSDYCSGIIS